MTRQAGAPAPMLELRARLSRRQLELEADINRKLDEVRSDRVGFDSSASTDGGDGALMDALGGVHHAEIERDMVEVGDIAATLERIEQGGYGICITCGEAIEAARLLAWPTAKRCTSCQRESERSRPKTSSL